MRKTVAIALQQDAGAKIIMNSTGRNREGEVVAIFSFEWSLRKKQAG
jgi:hypothetical protein